MKYLFTVLAFLLIAGCKSVHEPAIAVSNLSAYEAARVARIDVDNARKELDGLRIAYLQAWLRQLPDLTKPDQVRTMIELVMATSPARVPTIEQVAHAEEVTSALKLDDSKPAVQATAMAKVDVAALQAKILASDEAAKRETAARKLAEENLKLERLRAAEELERIKNAEMLTQQRWFRIAGGLLLLGSALTAGLSKLRSWELAAVLFIFGIGSLGVAQMVSRTWFLPVFYSFLVAIIVGAIVGIVYAVKAKVRLKATDDVIAGVEDGRKVLKKPAAETVQAIVNANNTNQALAAVAKLQADFDEQMKAWVTERDGTAAVVDERRRALNLVQ